MGICNGFRRSNRDYHYNNKLSGHQSGDCKPGEEFENGIVRGEWGMGVWKSEIANWKLEIEESNGIKNPQII